jgi:molybdenum cofactor guanylyltransferase
MSEPGKRADANAALGAVLAGGTGRRIGGGKAAVELGGRPLIRYPLAAVEGAGLEPLVIAKRDSDLPPLQCRVIREAEAHPHPLCGILAALDYAGERPVVVVGCDMPFLSPALLAWLAAQPEPLVAPRLDGRTQPFPALYGQSLLRGLREALAVELSMARALDSLAPRLLSESELAIFGEPERLCLNVNSPEDLARAERLLDLPLD